MGEGEGGREGGREGVRERFGLCFAQIKIFTQKRRKITSHNGIWH